jgi:hypothetical protein
MMDLTPVVVEEAALHQKRDLFSKVNLHKVKVLIGMQRVK